MNSSGGRNDRLLMKFCATILKFYSLGLLFSCLCTWLFNSRRATIEFLKAPVFWLGPLFFILLGLAIGGLLLILSKPKNRIRFLSNATLTGFLLFCITIASFQFYDWYHLKYLANIEANEEFLNSSSSYPPHEKQAFKMLTDKYKNPNDLRLTEISISKYDSIVDRVATKAYDIGFVYFKKSRNGHYKSRCTIVGNQGNLQYFDRLLIDSEEHLIDSSNNEGLRDGLKAILNDSAQLSLDSVAKGAIRNKVKSKKIVLDTLSEPR